MSYEGFEQHICENGHLFEKVCDYAFCETESKCPTCNAKSVWYNAVDQTNGEEYGVILAGEWERFKLSDGVVKVLNCGCPHTIKKATYRVPSPDEVKEIRSWYDIDKDVWRKCED